MLCVGQREAVQAVFDAHQHGVRRLLVTLPTGIGKTIIFALLAQQRGGRTLILAHRDELIQQAVDKVRLVMPAANIGRAKAEHNEVDAAIIVPSVQTLARPNRLAQVPTDVATLIVDEAHHATSDNTYARILDTMNAPLTLGVTATPFRSDEYGLGGGL